MKSEHDIFNGRYTVKIGSKGGVKVYSNISNKVGSLACYGNKKENNRYVNLIACRGGCSEPYLLEDIKQHISCGGVLSPLPEEVVKSLFQVDHLTKYILPSEEVLKLPCIMNQYNCETYTQYTDTNETITYQLRKYSKTTNGLLKGDFMISIKDEYNKQLFNTKSDPFVIKDCVQWDDITQISNEELGMIMDMLQKEVETR